MKAKGMSTVARREVFMVKRELSWDLVEGNTTKQGRQRNNEKWGVGDSKIA
jgi:hypothetical protein